MGVQPDPDSACTVSIPARRGLRLLALCSVLAGSLSAQPLLDLGSSPNFVGSGARALGQGNAFIAVADDATAASWNPGGLSQLERPEISLAIEGFRRRSDMTSTTHPEMASTDTVSLADLNYLSVVYPFRLGTRNTVLSLNYLKQYRFDAEGEFDFSLRDALGTKSPWLFFSDGRHRFEQEGCFSSLSPAIGIDVTDRLAVGLAVNIWNDDVTGDSSFRRSNRELGEYGVSYDGTVLGRSAYNVSTVDTYTVDAGTSLTLGTLYRISKRWSLGAVAKPPFALHLAH
jgi:long-subunit fatty acid transport protein